jgi:hypothetical protein
MLLLLLLLLPRRRLRRVALAAAVAAALDMGLAACMIRKSGRGKGGGHD